MSQKLGFIVALLLLPLIYMTVATVLGLVGTTKFSTEIQSMVVTAVVSGTLGTMVGYFLGSSSGSAQKTELLYLPFYKFFKVNYAPIVTGKQIGRASCRERV